MCFSSTCAMAIKYLRPDALRGSNADDDYLKTVLKYGDTTQYTAHIKACQQYGVLASFHKNGTKATLLSELKAGFPVATGILHHGPVSAPRGGGHWMLLIGDEGVNGVFHDPYGELDNVIGGYAKIGSGGKDVRYSWKNWLRRWEVEGPRTGWYMTFRPIKKDIPVPAKHASNSWEGVTTAAKTAGAKFPQVVAAQWALESGWGQHTSGKNNYFGIKGRTGEGSLVRTTEFIAGMEHKVDAWFKDFPSLDACVTELVTKWYNDYKGYKGVNRATTAEQCAQLLVKEGYATDPMYATKLINIMRSRNG
jgi:hypothetical protein